MQYHLNGFQSGDPQVADAVDMGGNGNWDVDVLIVGCGPAGLTLATQLSAFPEIKTRIVERKSGPLEFGQADGIACRSMEMFEAFGFANKVLSEAYWVNEVAFWRPAADDGQLHRADRIKDVEDDLSEMPHVILSQARVHDFYLQRMLSGPHRLVPDYGLELNDVQYTKDVEYPLEATLASEAGTQKIRARYVVGCDGARSKVRQIMGHALKGDTARQLWGVMDVLLVTDFPDIRLKAAIQSAGNGSLLVIPREGGYMVRMYVELDSLSAHERAGDRGVTVDALIQKARAIMAPFKMDVREVVWWSAYEIGQRLCERFDDAPNSETDARLPRIFIAGDACHTHSPKAGQGMNVSMADSFNLGWKIASVLRGQSTANLLLSYSQERHAKAKELIDFDRDMARLFSKRPETEEEAEEFQEYFRRHGRYTAGVETRYEVSLIVGSAAHQHLARGETVGMRFHSAPVLRLADARELELGHVLKADGRWRLIAFAPQDDFGRADGAVARFCEFLTCDPSSPFLRYQAEGSDLDSVFDFRAVFQTRELEILRIPSILVPRKGRLGLIDYEKVFCSVARDGSDIFDLRGIDRQNGALLVVRPDQFVAEVFPLDGTAELSDFFAGFMIGKAHE